MEEQCNTTVYKQTKPKLKSENKIHKLILYQLQILLSQVVLKDIYSWMKADGRWRDSHLYLWNFVPIEYPMGLQSLNYQ